MARQYNQWKLIFSLWVLLGLFYMVIDIVAPRLAVGPMYWVACACTGMVAWSGLTMRWIKTPGAARMVFAIFVIKFFAENGIRDKTEWIAGILVILVSFFLFSAVRYFKCYSSLP